MVVEGTPHLIMLIGETASLLLVARKAVLTTIFVEISGTRPEHLVVVIT